MKQGELSGIWFGPVAAVRPYWFRQCFLLLVGVDVFALMIPRGSRYGTDGFSIAHFTWLDAWQPFPTAEWYVTVMTVAGLLSFYLLFAGPVTWLHLLLVGLYSYGWCMSRLDSYMHHYMASLILASIAFFPAVRSKDLFEWQVSRRPYRAGPKIAWRDDLRFIRDGWGYVGFILIAGLAYRLTDALAASWAAFAGYLAIVVLMTTWRMRQGVSNSPWVSAWAFRMLGATVGVIYFYTSVTKCDWEWVGGHTLQHVGNAAYVLDPMVNLAARLGLPPSWFWSIAATLVIPLELTLSLSYFLSIFQDDPRRRWLRLWCPIAFLLAIGLHMNNEMMGLSIQWFGYYMMFLACFFLLPERVLVTLSSTSVWLGSWWTARFERLPQRMGTPWRATALGVALTLVIAAVFGDFARIPGVLAGALAFAITLGVWEIFRWLLAGLRSLRKARILEASPGAASNEAPSRLADGNLSSWLGVAAIVAAWLVVWAGGTRFSYFEIRGRTYQLMGRDQEALGAMLAAADYAHECPRQMAEFLVNLGLAQRRMGHNAAAIDCYRQALERDPRLFLAHYNWGNLLRESGQPGEAIGHYQAALALKSHFSDAHVNLGLCLDALGNTRAAREHYLAALRIEPGAADIVELLSKSNANSPVSRDRHAVSVPPAN